jgi:plasmid stabilization system protein ParE
MKQYRFTPEAAADLFEIWSYIADDDAQAANRVEDAIHAACVLLAESPLAGSVRNSERGNRVRPAGVGARNAHRMNSTPRCVPFGL